LKHASHPAPSKLSCGCRPRPTNNSPESLMGSPADIPTRMPLPTARNAGRAAFQAGRLSDVLNQQ
jgi:hypothetical protein